MTVRGDVYALQSEVHEMLRRHRRAGEWFAMPPEIAVAAISGAAYRLEVSASEADPRPPLWGCRILIASLALLPAFTTLNLLLFIVGSLFVSTWMSMTAMRTSTDWLDLPKWICVMLGGAAVAVVLGALLGSALGFYR